MRVPIFARVLGEQFEILPARVRELHDVTAVWRWWGLADVERGTSLGARIVAALGRLPPSGLQQPLTVTLEPIAGAETWTRDFSGRRFKTRLFAAHGRISEIIGPLRLVFALEAGTDGLTFRLEGADLFGVPLPRDLWPRVRSRAFQQQNRYHFDVAVHLPLIGLLVAYRGWLLPEAEKSPSIALH